MLLYFESCSWWLSCPLFCATALGRGWHRGDAEAGARRPGGLWHFWRCTRVQEEERTRQERWAGAQVHRGSRKREGAVAWQSWVHRARGEGDAGAGRDGAWAGGVLVGDGVRRDTGTCALQGGGSCAGHTAGRRRKSGTQGARAGSTSRAGEIELASRRSCGSRGRHEQRRCGLGLHENLQGTQEPLQGRKIRAGYRGTGGARHV
jgi:hypothetical protein